MGTRRLTQGTVSTRKLTIPDDEPRPTRRSKAPVQDPSAAIAWWSLHLALRLEAFITAPSLRTRATLDAIVNDYAEMLRLGEIEPPPLIARH